MRFLSIALLATCFAQTTLAADWPHWRGPAYNGSSPERNLPDRFSRTENIAWKAELSGVAASTPIVSGDRVFLSGVDEASDKLLALGFRRSDGKLLWKHEVADGTKRDKRSNYASSSPATDGRVVIFFYGNGELAAFDLDGRRLWARSLYKDYGTFAFLWTFSSSPLLFDGKLYIQVLQRDVAVGGRGFEDRENQSYLLALDPPTGKELWRQIRPSKAREESREGFTSPIPWDHAGRKEVLVVGGDALTGHDAATGAELWRWETWNLRNMPHWRLVPSPVAGDGIVLVCAPKKDPIYAIRPEGKGDLGKKAIAWVSPEGSELTDDVPTSAFYDGDFFVLSDLKRALVRVEPRTGKIKWSIATPGKAKYEASPTAADGKIYILNHAGEASAVNAADGKILHTAAMDQPANGELVRASIAAANGQLFLRTTRTLYCIGGAPQRR